MIKHSSYVQVFYNQKFIGMMEVVEVKGMQIGFATKNRATLTYQINQKLWQIIYEEATWLL